MRSSRLAKHIGITAAGLILTLVLPGLFFASSGGFSFAGRTDAVSGATLVLPDTPSGNYLVIVNRDRHPETMSAWRSFFTEQEVGVIMEDLSCLAIAQDAGAVTLAERFRARLAANQMRLFKEEGVLVASRAENGVYDVVIISEDMAEAVGFDAVLSRADAEVIAIKGISE